MSTRTISLTVPFANVTPNELFDFLDGSEKARSPDRLIVQTWRGSVWVKDDTDSVLILFFEEMQDGAQVHNGARWITAPV